MHVLLIISLSGCQPTSQPASVLLSRHSSTWWWLLSLKIPDSWTGYCLGWGCTKPVVWTTLGTACRQCPNWVGISGRPLYVTPGGSAGWKKNPDSRVARVNNEFMCFCYLTFWRSITDLLPCMCLCSPTHRLAHRLGACIEIPICRMYEILAYILWS